MCSSSGSVWLSRTHCATVVLLSAPFSALLFLLLVLYQVAPQVRQWKAWLRGILSWICCFMSRLAESSYLWCWNWLGQNCTLLSFCPWRTLLQGKWSRFCITLHWADSVASFPRHPGRDSQGPRLLPGENHLLGRDDNDCHGSSFLPPDLHCNGRHFFLATFLLHQKERPVSSVTAASVCIPPAKTPASGKTMCPEKIRRWSASILFWVKFVCLAWGFIAVRNVPGRWILASTLSYCVCGIFTENLTLCLCDVIAVGSIKHESSTNSMWVEWRNLSGVVHRDLNVVLCAM